MDFADPSNLGGLPEHGSRTNQRTNMIHMPEIFEVDWQPPGQGASINLVIYPGKYEFSDANPFPNLRIIFKYHHTPLLREVTAPSYGPHNLKQHPIR